MESDERGPAEVRCTPVTLLPGDDFPPRVEVELVDVDGRAWRFVDKLPIFTRGWPDGRLPTSLIIRCEVLDFQQREGRSAVRITTARPDSVGSEPEDADTFVVWLDHLVGAPPADSNHGSHVESLPGPSPNATSWSSRSPRCLNSNLSWPSTSPTMMSCFCTC